jgi:malonyl CoA-acyl carrier protein transacylase
MNNQKMIAVVGLGAILPDADDTPSFWQNILSKKYSITDVPSDRWNVDLYFDPDPSAVDKTYCKIGAFVRNFKFDPLKNGIAIPPKVLTVMDTAQQWAIAASQQALKDYGYPEKKLDPTRVAVIFGNSNAGEMHYRSTFRIFLPEYLDILQSVPDFERLPNDVKVSLLNGVTEKVHSKIPAITEDTMPGELSNIISGRVANIFNFTGPNFITDAACASSLAAIQVASEGLLNNKFDAVLSGGIDRNMGPESYIKFSKIGALSADGSRPYAEGANGFVMGEGAVVFLLKRLEDAERDGDKIYALVRGIGSSSDGKGKGITAPNPLGQQRAIERAWCDAGINPESVGLIEGHGTSTKVGDVTEVSSLNTIFGSLGLKTSSVVLGSVKSNIGHLKSASGAVGLLKTILSLHHRVLPPSANFKKPNPNIDFSNLPFRVNTQPQEWTVQESNYRFAGVSAFGFGGTNFHVVLEEYFPGVAGNSSAIHAIPRVMQTGKMNSISADVSLTPEETEDIPVASTVNQNDDIERIKEYILSTVSEKTGYPIEMLDLDLDLEADLGIDTVKQAELFAAVRTNYGIPRHEDLRLSDYNTITKVVSFVHDSLNSGLGQSLSFQEKQVVVENVVKTTSVVSMYDPKELKPYQGLFFASADSATELKKSLQENLEKIIMGTIPDSNCPSEEELSRQERIAIDYADPQELSKRLEKALIAFESENPVRWKALQAHGIYRGSGKPGKVAFLFPGQGSQYVNMLLDLRDSEPVVRDTFDEADRVMTPILGRALTSFIYTQGGEEEIQQAEKELKNTAITQPAMLTADVAVLRVLQKYGVEPDMVIGHSLGEYAALVAAGVLTFAEALEVVSARGREMTSIKVDDPGCMAAVSAPLEKVEETIRSIHDYLVIANINSPVQSVLGGTTSAIDIAIAKFQADGFQAVKIPVSHAFHTKIVAPVSVPLREVIARMSVKPPVLPIVANVTGDLYPTGREEILDILASQVASPVQFVKGMKTLYEHGVRIFIEAGPKRVLNALASDNLKDKDDVTIIATNHPRKGGKASFNEALCGIYAAGVPTGKNEIKEMPVSSPKALNVESTVQVKSETVPQTSISITGSVVISGAGLGLPGRNKHVFEDSNIESILNGDMRIEPLTENARRGMLEKHVTRLVKSEAGAVMEEITDIDQTLKLAGQSGQFDLVEEFGVPEERVESLDASTQLAIAAGIEALRDAGIPLVIHHRRTTKGTYLPDRWKLPESMQDETGVIFCSAFPGLNRMAEEADRFYETHMLESQLFELRSIMDLVNSLNPTGQTQLQNDLQRRMIELEKKIKEKDYHFDRRYVFRILSMGHSQFAEYIGARGPNTHVNAACATTTHAVAIAEDWIRAGRCRRVIVIAGDDVTNPTLVSWIGTSLLASGAATTEGNLRMAALPFDKRRNGMIMGMGAAALVIESEDSVRERGVRAIGEILSSVIANSAFHGTRLDMQHVSEMMERLLVTAEERFGIRREQIAPEMVFVSHETYTPARGGSANAEIHALRSCFRDHANRVVIANTKGFTGHSMGVGIEDVVAVKALETGKVPPIAYIHEGFKPDPGLGDLNLSQGGVYNPQYALRLAAGFGSQIAMTLVHKIPDTGERINREKYNQWLSAVAGYNQPELEVVQRTLRIKSQGIPVREPAQSTWKYGQGPRAWATAHEIDLGASIASTPVANSSVLTQIETVKVDQVQEEPAKKSSLETVQLNSGKDEPEIKAYVLSVVSEKTGYPVEMLDLGLDLEADLGIDTVKQAELFAAIRTHYGIPRREDLILADYNTLAKVISFVQDALVPTSKPAQVEPVESAKVVSESVEAESNLIEKDSLSEDTDLPKITRRVPVPVLFPRIDLCMPTGAILDGNRVVVVSDRGKVSSALIKKLKTINAEVLQTTSSDAGLNLADWMKNGSIAGLFFLTALDTDPVWEKSSIEEWRNARSERLETLYHIARTLPESAFLIGATRMGGLHGLLNVENPLGGAVTGFLKALRRERPQQLVKVIDFELKSTPGFIAEELVLEALHDPVSAEIGRENDLRYGISLKETQIEPSGQTTLETGSVFVVSGGTGGITGPIVSDLAKATRGTFYLMGRTQLMDKDDPDLRKIKSNRNAFRLELQERLAKAGEKVTPVQLEQKLSAIERAAATMEVMKVVETSGGKAVYMQCDVTNPKSVSEAVESISKAEKRVNVFIHAAGLEKSRKIESKSLEEFQQVVAVKADGFLNIFRSLEKFDLLPEKVVFFSSVAGRFGNAGQTDYSAANDLLSKYAMWLPKKYPKLQSISIDWGAWAEVGMASRGNIPMLMERAGMEMLKPCIAAPMVRNELTLGQNGEVVIAGSLGLLESSATDYCGLDIEKADSALRAGTPIHSMFSHLVGFHQNTGIRLEAKLDPEELSYLRDHAINGIPVLPGVMGIEGFSVASKHIASVLASGDSGFEVERLENIEFHAPFKFYGNKPRTITWNAVAYREAGGLIVKVSLESDIKRWNGSTDHVLHFSGLVHLSQNLPIAETVAIPPKWGNKKSVTSEEIYQLYFHGPSFQVLDAAQLSENTVLGRFNKRLADVSADEPGLFTTPLLIELCFQTAGLWEVGATGILALPHSIGSLKLFQRPLNGVAIFAVVKPREYEGRLSFDARVVDAKGNVFLELTNYQTSPLPYPAEKDLVEPMKVLVSELLESDC